MRKLNLILLIIISNYSFGQTNLDKQTIERKGFVIGLGLGAGVLSLNSNDTLNVSFSKTLPNIKVGYMVNKRLALLALLPWANYKYDSKYRGFECFIISGKY